MTVYRLRKELLVYGLDNMLSIGTIFIKYNDCYLVETPVGQTPITIPFSARSIENNPDYFALVENKGYTEEDMRKCFEAARKPDYSKPDVNQDLYEFLNPTFEDYLKSLNK